MRDRAALWTVLSLLLLAACAQAQETPALELRGSAESFPFSLGTTMYGGMWDGNRANESRTDWWWFDKDVWREKFESMERLHLNALAFTHPHPFPAFVDLEAYPDARYFDADTVRRYQEQFRWIVDEGVAHSVRLYFLTWNICLPPQFASKRGLPEFGADTDLTRAYTRETIAALFRTYPKLGGLITMAAETPPGCVDFVADAICGGMQESGTQPELIFWSWCSYPEDSARILKAYPRTRLLHYLQYEQFFLPRADPRIGRFSKACGRAPMVALGGPKSAHGYLFWGDPEWARETVADLRTQHGTGLFIETYCEEPWLAHEAFARYAYALEDRYDRAAWATRVGEHYHCPESGAALLEAMSRASRIVPSFLKLVHSQTDHYMPQFGLPLVYYLEMPTLSSYIFENVQTTDAKGFLRPNLGLCWPNPDWGEHVLSVREAADGKEHPGATTPESIAQDMEANAKAVETFLDSGEAAAHPELSRLFDRLRLNASLGDHYCAKIRAAVAWARFERGEDTGKDCVARLDDSVRAWERVVDVANRLFPEDVPYWKSDLSSAPPWTQNQLWNAYTNVKGHWRGQLEPFRRELELVREAFAQGPDHASLPLWEELRAAPPNKLELVFADDFEKRDETHWIWGDASLTTAPGEAIQGAHSLRFDTRDLPGEWHQGVRCKPDAVPMRAGQRYQISFDYRVIAEGIDYPEGPFAVAARSDTAGIDHDIGEARFWTGRVGSLGRRVVTFAPQGFDDYSVFLSAHGRGAVAIDRFRIYRVID